MSVGKSPYCICLMSDVLLILCIFSMTCKQISQNHTSMVYHHIKQYPGLYFDVIQENMILSGYNSVNMYSHVIDNLQF